MQEHPNNIIAGAALSSLREAWGWLPDLIDSSARIPRTPATPNAGQRLARARQAAAELADKPALIGAKPTGGTPAPLRVAAVDAQTFALTTVTEAAYDAQSELRSCHGLKFGGPWTMPLGETRWTFTCEFLAGSIPHLHPDTATRVGRNLDTADRAIRNLAGVGRTLRPVHVPCPTCGRLGTLQAETSDPNPERWTFACNGSRCRCTGIDCPCRRPGRQPGQRHVWPASALPNLDRILGKRAA